MACVNYRTEDPMDAHTDVWAPAKGEMGLFKGIGLGLGFSVTAGLRPGQSFCRFLAQRLQVWARVRRHAAGGPKEGLSEGPPPPVARNPSRNLHPLG